MSTVKKNTLQRVSIVVNLIMVVFWILLFSPLTYFVSPELLKSLFPISGVLFMLSSYFSFQKTGLLKFTHLKTKDLDERELKVTNNAIRFAYSVLAIVISLFLFVIALTSWQIHIMHAAFTLYIAHSLPAVYLGWKGEKR